MLKKFFYMLVLFVLVTPTLTRIRETTAQDASPPPLADRGPYLVGQRKITLVDESRDNRQIVVELWYPALMPDGSDVDLSALQGANRGLKDAPPDTSQAPYPLILYSHSMYGTRFDLKQFTEPLASHGFVVAGMDHRNSWLAQSLIDRPLDILFVLDQLAAITEGDLLGLMDTNKVGMMGNCFGGYTAMAITGSRINPAAADTVANTFSEWNWDELAAYQAQHSPSLEGEALWHPFTDERIKAVLGFVPCTASLFGEGGLAAATIPTFIVGGSDDTDCLYQSDAVYFYEHLGSQDKYLLTIIGGDHSTYSYPSHTPAVRQFVTAYFGLYLQEQEDYADYLTAAMLLANSK